MNNPSPLESIFFDALKKPSPVERAAFLDEACASDDELRRGVERLLTAQAEAGSFLESPAADFAVTTDPTPIAERPGTVIGPYKLLQQIGEGGMGVVFMAEQTEPLERTVALKIIKPGMDTRQVIARFEAERQAVAMMDHPNIAKVLDAGTTASGRPYFVMELVKGIPITKYCDDKHLPLRARLELFVQVCQAVQHAHQKGIIHRDIKPTNVLVAEYDNHAIPKVIDFGVAKATAQKLTERTMFTEFGQVLGTLEYMSPEQAKLNQLDIDTRSDVYSLGVLLYELLAGSTPFEEKRLHEAAFDEMLRIIREEEPPKPSTRLSSLSLGERAGVRESLASIAANRGSEPAKLGGLVAGELDWIVMKCLEKDRNRRYGSASAFATDIERHLHDEPVEAGPPSAAYRFRKFAKRNKAAIGLAGIVLFFLVLLGSGAGWALRDRAAREQVIAQENARKLALTEQGIRQALDQGTKSRAELQALLKKPGGVQQLLNQPARWDLFIKTAQGEVAQARRLAVREEGLLGAEWTRAMDVLERQLTSDRADYELALHLEKIRADRATLVDGRFNFRMAGDEYPKALAGFAVLNDDPATVAARISSSPIKDQLVAALDDWALVAFSLLDEFMVEHLLAVARQAAPDPMWGDRLRRYTVWRDQEALGKLVAEAPSAELSPQLLDLVGSLLHGVDSPLTESWLRQAQIKHPTDFWLNFNLAKALFRTDPVESTGFYRSALAVRPGNSAAYNNLGCSLYVQRKLSEAIVAFDKALESYPTHAFAYRNLGSALFDQRKLPEALAAYRKAVEIAPTYSGAYIGVGNTLFDQGKEDDAFTWYDKAIELDANHAWALAGRGWAHMKRGQFDKALADQAKAIELEPNQGQHWNDRSVTFLRLGQLESALGDCAKALSLDPKFASAWFNQGEAHRRLGQFEMAAVDYRTALNLKTLHKPDIPLAYRNLAIVLNKIGNKEEARMQHEYLVELANKDVELTPKDPSAWQTLGWDQYRAGAWKESIEALETSCKLQQGGTGDFGQWIVLALAHGQLANEKELSESGQTRHKAEARRWYDQAVKQIDSWSASGGGVSQASQDFHETIRGFRLEAAELLGVKEKWN